MAENESQANPTGANPAPQPTNPTPSGTPSSGNSGGTSGLAPNIASLLCYVCTIITGIIFLVIEKQDKEVRFHAWQSVFLGGSGIAISIIINILGFIFSALAGFLGVLISIVGLVINIALFVVWIIAMIKAYQGEHWLIPVIGNLAEQQTERSK